MSPHKTVIINGRKYDAATGLPVAETPAKAKPTAKPAAKPTPKKVANSERVKNPSEAVHSTLQRSKTLIRRATKKPVGKVSAAFAKPKPGRHMDFARSPKITHFAPHPTPKAKPSETAAAPVKQHPTVTKALNNTPKRAPKPVAAKAAPSTAKQVKDDAITKALKTPKAAPKKVKKSFWANKWARRVGIVAGLFILIGGSAYLIYQFVPSVSVSFAAAQANIDASYPEYTPDGFALKQPVTYSDGQVDLTFASNSNDTTYTITQKRSTWDSTAVLDSIVKTSAGDDYTTTRERGLTIYTYGTNAAWVNSGILYTIDSNAALSGDQVRRIAISL